MCMAIPMRVLRSESARAWCQGRQGEAWIDTLLTGPLESGVWVLTFLGAAREGVCADHAAQVNAALDALEAIQAGRMPELDACFADLVNREPRLPEHLLQPAPAKAAPLQPTGDFPHE